MDRTSSVVDQFEPPFKSCLLLRSMRCPNPCRSANTVAHLCARAASLGGVSQEWLGAIPDFLADGLSADCTRIVLS
jgi:hypothetical protein